VVGRAAVSDLLLKATRFDEAERQRLTIHLPSKAITLRFDEVERHFAASLMSPMAADRASAPK
jgi:hypothetical protein